jgi:hypothetical protein
VTFRASTSVEQVRSVAFGHGVTCSLMGRSEDFALATWAQVAHDAGFDVDLGWRSVSNGWALREACSWQEPSVGIRTIVARSLRPEAPL